MPNAVFIASGKGGTGKSLVAVNIAQSLNKMGKKVGLIDADISSPNIPMFLKLKKSIQFEREKLKPVNFKGIKVYSMGLIAGDAGICMVGGQYAQILRDVVNFSEWGKLDYFVIDLPASNSDEFKEMVETFQDNFLGTIIVMQPAHEMDARRVIKLHLDNEIPVVGLIENMSYFKSGKFRCKVFGESTVDKLAKKFKLKSLGKIPLCMRIRKSVETNYGLLEGELGTPIKNAVDKILKSKPKKPGFLEKLKERAKASLRLFLIRMVISANQDVNIKEMQQKYGYEGRRIIRLSLMDDVMRKVLEQRDLMIVNGRLVHVENAEEEEVALKVEMTTRALVWSFLSKELHSGRPYTLESAWYMGELRVWGYGDSVRGLYFMKNVWESIRQNKNAMSKIQPLLEKLA